MRTISGRLALIATALAVGATACGGPAALAPAAVASGGDREAAQYVEGLCRSADRMVTAYQGNLYNAGASVTGMDPTDAFIRLAREPYAQLVTDLERVPPLPEAKDGHAQALAEVRNLRDAIAAADRSRVLSMTLTPDTGKWRRVIPLPPDLRARLGPAADSAPACRDLRSHSGAGLFD